MKQFKKYKEVYLVFIRPNTTWTQELPSEYKKVKVLSLEDPKGTGIIFDTKTRHEAYDDLESYTEYPILKGAKEIQFKNNLDKVKSFLVFVE